MQYSEKVNPSVKTDTITSENGPDSPVGHDEEDRNNNPQAFLRGKRT